MREEIEKIIKGTLVVKNKVSISLCASKIEEYLYVSAYDKGRCDHERVMVAWIENWDGNTRSSMGRRLRDKIEELKLCEK